MRRGLIGLVAVGSLVSLLVGLVLAQAKKADAILTLTGGLGGGRDRVLSWEQGTLDYQGRSIPSRSRGCRWARWA